MTIVKLILIFLVLITLVQLAITFYSFRRARTLTKTIFTGNYIFGENNKELFQTFMVGDSVGAGVGASSAETSLVGRIGNFYAANFKVSIDNQSVSGYKIEDLLSAPAPKDKVNLIVIVAGSNNFFRFTQTQKLEDDTEKVLAKYAPLGEKVILVGPGRIFDTLAVPFFIRPIHYLKGDSYGSALQKASLKFPNVIHVNPLKTNLKSSDFGHTLASDNFHPNDAGYKFWFEMIKPNL